jgi:hypothetical protein
MKARARHIPGIPNKTEAEYMLHLEACKREGLILEYAYEPIKLRLAKRTYYTPDFAVIRKDRVIELHEIKGHWEDDARVKIKVAAEKYPWLMFIALKKLPKKDGGGWAPEVFGV